MELNSLFLVLLISKTVCAFNLTIIHNNDIHARLVPTNVYGEDCENENDELCYGGIAKIVQKAEELRTQIPNLLFLNAGDSFVGTLWYSLFKWPLLAEMVKKMKFDAMSFGNHEFDEGVEGLAPYVKDTSSIIPTLACNLDISGEPRFKDIVHKSKVFEIEGQKIAVIGYITPETADISSPGPTLNFYDEVKCIRSEINVLKEKGINIFIALGHSGFDVDKKIAEKVPEVDIVVGGHSNTFLWNGKQPSAERPVDKYPTVVQHDDGSVALVVQAFAFGKYLGFLNVNFDEKGNVIDYSGLPIVLDHTVSGDQEIKTMLAPKALLIKQKYESAIGTTAVMLDGDCRRHECNLGNLIADAMVFAALNSNGTKSRNGWTEYPAAFLTGGGIRVSISETNNGGNISIKDVIRVLPNEKMIVGLSLPGFILKQVFEHSVFRITPETTVFAGEFSQVSGFRVKYDLSRPVGSKVQKLEIRCGEDCRVPKYEPIDNTLLYKVLVTDYHANGGDLYSMLTHFKQNPLKVSLSQSVVVYISKHSPISTGLELRSQFVNDGEQCDITVKECFLNKLPHQK